MKIISSFLSSSLVILLLHGCMGGGTHGSIKCYQFAVSKSELEKAVKNVILNTSTIKQDSIKDYYNNDTNYISISINQEVSAYKYIFHFYGSKEYWNASKISAISIAYAYDGEGKGGSSGNGGIKWYDFTLKKKLTEPFERELVLKIDSILGIKHTEE